MKTTHGGGFWNLSNDSVNRVLVQMKSDLSNLVESNLAQNLAGIQLRVTKLEKMRKTMKDKLKMDMKCLYEELNQNREKCIIEREKVIASIKKNSAMTSLIKE